MADTDMRTAALDDVATTARVRRYGATRTSAPGETFARAGLKMTPPQAYAIARDTLKLLGIDWPADRAEASLLIGRLREQLAADTAGATACAGTTSDPMPF